ncbi:hypothetical protein LTR94_036187, partial [Friedmanniomyces endolithicus]
PPGARASARPTTATSGRISCPSSTSVARRRGHGRWRSSSWRPRAIPPCRTSPPACVTAGAWAHGAFFANRRRISRDWTLCSSRTGPQAPAGRSRRIQAWTTG